jgi:DNA-binding response OmpR family regulator
MSDEALKPSPLTGRSVLIVEDETIISLEIEQMLQELACGIIWHAANVSQALRILAEHRPDFALLDVNLGSEKVFPVAEALIDQSVPFIFATGYGREGLPLEWAGWPVIRKPYLMRELAARLFPLLQG